MSSLISFGLFRYQGFYPVSQPSTIHSEPADQVQKQVFRVIVLYCYYFVLLLFCIMQLCKGIKKMVEDNIQRGQDVKTSSPSLPRFAVSVISRRWCCKVFYGSHWSHLLANYTMSKSILTSNVLHIYIYKYIIHNI